MAIQFELTSIAAPREVLAALRAEARRWRESELPPELRGRGILRVDGRVRGAEFRLWCARRWYPESRDIIEVRGDVMPEPGGGSRVRVRCGRSGLGATVLALGAFALWVAFNDLSGAVLLLAIMGIVAAVMVLRDRAVSRANPEAEFLLDRVEHAVSTAEESRAAASESRSPAG